MADKNSNVLSDTFTAPPSEHISKWNNLYSTSYHPWDRATPSLALSDLLQQRTDLIPPSQDLSHTHPVRDETGKVIKKTALVPGCGFGHDVLLLAARGYDVWGVDGSEEAIKGARRNEEEVAARRERGERKEEGEEVYECEKGVERGSVNWVVADVFAEGWEKGLGSDGSGTFDLVFDYTFLCALPLTLRPTWASRITHLLSHASTSRIICLEFPTGKPHTEAGPPWGVWPETYEALLSNPGEDVEYHEDGRPKERCLSKPGKGDVEGVHRVCLSKPGRTHKAGTNEDGSVKDFISVWSR